MRTKTTVIAFVVAVFVANSPLLAQQRHVTDLGALQQAVSDRAATDQHTRDVVLNVLHRAEVRDLASHLGLNVTQAENAVPTLSSQELARLAGPAQIADLQLAGGSDPIVISLTTLLLIVILVILVAR